MNPAVFIREETAQLMASNFLRRPYYANASVSKHKVRGEMKGYRVNLLTIDNKLEYITDDHLE